MSQNLSRKLRRKSAGELSRIARKDTTKYNSLEVGHAMTDDVDEQIRICIENHKSIIDEPIFCVVLIISKDPLLDNMIRRKYYAWPYLPKPRPNQAVFLYNKALDRITHRLWVLPSDMVMAELHSLSHVHPKYKTMKEWSDAFYFGWKYDKITNRFYNADPFHFWKFIRKQAGINLESEHEYFLAHREELIKAGCKIPGTNNADPFDFNKIAIKQVIDSDDPLPNEDSLNVVGKA